MPPKTDYPKPGEVEITRISPGVCVIIRDDEGRVLLQRRSDNGLWGLPGGAIEPGESVEQAGRREALEETGLDVEITGLFGVFSDPNAGMLVRYPDGNVHHFIVAAVLARVAGEGRRSTDDETLELAWADPVRPPEDMVPPHRIRLRDLIARTPPVLG